MKTAPHTTTVSTFLGRLKTECEGPVAKDEWLSPQQVSRELAIHINSVYRWIKSRELPAYDLGTEGKRYYRVRRSDLEAWLEAKTNQRLSP